MNDLLASGFLAPGWGWYVAILTDRFSLLACLWILLWQTAAKQKSILARRPRVKCTARTNGRLARSTTIALPQAGGSWSLLHHGRSGAFGYLAVVPRVNRQPRGRARLEHLVPLSRAEVKEISRRRRPIGPLFDASIAKQDVENCLRRIIPSALTIGARNCFSDLVACNVTAPTDACSSRGFPNLVDNDWLWGGSARRRSRRRSLEGQAIGVMPPFAGTLKPDRALRQGCRHSTYCRYRDGRTRARSLRRSR